MATVPAATRVLHDDNIDAEIAALAPWFHNLHLPDGRQTAPGHSLGDFPAFKWREIEPHIPADLSGWRVLDIGCNAGYYSFKLAERGADVVAMDVDAHYLRQAQWAAQRFGLAGRIHFRQMQIYDLIREPGSYDLIWFMGVLYHLRHPLLALDIVRRKAAKLMVFQTMTMPGDGFVTVPEDMTLDERSVFLDPGWPKMAFIEKKLREDPTNWWAPNRAGVEALLRSSGFDVRARIADECWLCEAASHPGESVLRRMIDEELVAAAGLQPAAKGHPT